MWPSEPSPWTWKRDFCYNDQEYEIEQHQRKMVRVSCSRVTKATYSAVSHGGDVVSNRTGWVDPRDHYLIGLFLLRPRLVFSFSRFFFYDLTFQRISSLFVVSTIDPPHNMLHTPSSTAVLHTTCMHSFSLPASRGSLTYTLSISQNDRQDVAQAVPCSAFSQETV